MRKRSKQKTLYLSEKEYKAMKQKVKKLKLNSDSELIRNLIADNEPIPAPDDEFYRVMKQLDSLEISLNRLTRNFHRNGWLEEKDYKSISKYLNELMIEVKEKYLTNN